MAKVIFEFDECEDRNDINLIVNRHKIMNALIELDNYRRRLNKCCETNAIIVNDNKVLGKIIDEMPEDYDGLGKIYIEDEIIIAEIDRILREVKEIINEY